MNEVNYPETLRKAAALIELDKAAQAVLDVERPGEKVQEILINSDSAKSVKELLAPPAPKPTKTVYTVMFGYKSWNGNTLSWPTQNTPNRFDNLSDALKRMEEVQVGVLNINIEAFYFIEKAEVEA